MRIKKETIFTIITIGFVATAIDVLSFIAGLQIANDPMNRLYLYRKLPQEKDIKANYKNYLKIRHPVLGWPSPTQFGGPMFDKIGARRSPAFDDPDQHKACISLYGDSFTYSDEVENQHAWGNILATLQNCRVNNFGVGGYGTDQAYLRYSGNHRDRSPIVILGIYSENIRRNVNQYRGFYRPGTGHKFGFKPRFMLADSKLERIPLPNISIEDLEDFSNNPKKYLEHDFYSPDGIFRTRFRFPYSVTLIEAFFKMQRRDNIMPVSRFYSETHPSGSLQLTVAIVKAFKDTALSRNQTPVVLFIPSNKALKKFQRTGNWEHQIFLDKLNQIENLHVLNSEEKFIEYLGQKSPNTLFLGKRGHSHFNQKGYHVLATIVSEALSEIKSAQIKP